MNMLIYIDHLVKYLIMILDLYNQWICLSICIYIYMPYIYLGWPWSINDWSIGQVKAPSSLTFRWESDGPWRCWTCEWSPFEGVEGNVKQFETCEILIVYNQSFKVTKCSSHLSILSLICLETILQTYHMFIPLNFIPLKLRSLQQSLKSWFLGSIRWRLVPLPPSPRQNRAEPGWSEDSHWEVMGLLVGDWITIGKP